MTPLIKEYRAILGASIFALLTIGGSGAFLWQALESHSTALAEMANRNAAFESLCNSNPTPTEAVRKQLDERKKASTESLEKLHAGLSAMNIPLEKIQPLEFQTALNTKTQNFMAKAAKSRVTIPRGAKESEPFSMDFDDFTKRVPSEDKVSLVNRQLTAADRLLNTLLDSKPLSLVGFKIDRPEEPKAPKVEPKPGKAVQTSPALLSAQGFDLKFTSSPDSLRDFTNALARDKQAFFVVRRIKITTLSKEGVPMLAPSKTILAPPADPAATSQPATPAVAQYILGDEHLEVEMRVDLLSVLSLPLPAAVPAVEKSGKPATREGNKQP